MMTGDNYDPSCVCLAVIVSIYDVPVCYLKYIHMHILTFIRLIICVCRFHADVHGGNLLVLEDGRVAFIDFGIG